MQQAMSRLKSQQDMGRLERARARSAMTKLDAGDSRRRKAETIIWWSAWVSAMETAADVVRVCPCKHGQGGYDEIVSEDVEVHSNSKDRGQLAG